MGVYIETFQYKRLMVLLVLVEWGHWRTRIQWRRNLGTAAVGLY